MKTGRNRCGATGRPARRALVLALALLVRPPPARRSARSRRDLRHRRERVRRRAQRRPDLPRRRLHAGRPANGPGAGISSADGHILPASTQVSGGTGTVAAVAADGERRLVHRRRLHPCRRHTAPQPRAHPRGRDARPAWNPSASAKVLARPSSARPCTSAATSTARSDQRVDRTRLPRSGRRDQRRRHRDGPRRRTPPSRRWRRRGPSSTPAAASRPSTACTHAAPRRRVRRLERRPADVEPGHGPGRLHARRVGLDGLPRWSLLQPQRRHRVARERRSRRRGDRDGDILEPRPEPDRASDRSGGLDRVISAGSSPR